MHYYSYKTYIISLLYDICLLFDDVTVHFNLIGVQDSEPDTSPHSGYGWERDYIYYNLQLDLQKKVVTLI